jgi:hypothetical protein
MATYNEYASKTQGPVGKRSGPEEAQNVIKAFEESQEMARFIKEVPNNTEATKGNEKPPLKAPTNLKEVKELLDPNSTGIITTERAKEAADALQQGISNSNFLVRRAAKNELEGASPEEAMKNIKARLGLTPESLEAAKEIQDAVVRGANREQLVARESGKDYKVTAKENPGLYRENFQKIAAEQIRALDKNGNLEVHANETPEAAAAIKNAMSMLPQDTKRWMLEESERKQQEDPNGKETAKSISKIAGISVTPEAVLELRKAAIAGLKSANPNPEVAKKEEEEERTAKDGKGNVKGKNFFETLMDFLKPLFVALGFIKEEPTKDTELVKKDATPEKKEEKTAKGEGREQERQAQLTSDEKQKSFEYLTKLDETVQRDIRHAGAQANGVGTIYSAEATGMQPQMQTASAGRQPRSAGMNLD